MYMIPYTRRSNSSMMDLFDELERSMFGESGRRTPVFSTDIRDEGAHYLLQADLPGFRKEDIAFGLAVQEQLGAMIADGAAAAW